MTIPKQKIYKLSNFIIKSIKFNYRLATTLIKALSFAVARYNLIDNVAIHHRNSLREALLDAQRGAVTHRTSSYREFLVVVKQAYHAVRVDTYSTRRNMQHVMAM